MPDAAPNAPAVPALTVGVDDVLVGIDPGTETGLAVVAACDARRVLHVGSDGPLGTVRRLEAWAASGRLACAYVEDARDLPLYARHGQANRGQRDRDALRHVWGRPAPRPPHPMI